MNSKIAYIKISLLLIGFIFFIQCDKEIIDSFDKFPSDIGNKWIYEKTLIFIPYGQDSILQYNFADTQRYEIIVEVDKTLIPDKINIETLQFSSKEINIPEIVWYQYYTNNNYGLLFYAYTIGSPNVFARKKKSIEFRDLEASIDIEFIISKMFYLNSTNNSEDSLFYLENPSVSLKYPLRVGSNWDYVKNDNMEIKKSIIDIVNVRTDAGSFECYKIKYIYKKSQKTNNIDCYEYYGSKGLIKREIYIDNISITDAYGRVIDNGKAIELIKLKDYTIKN